MLIVTVGDNHIVALPTIHLRIQAAQWALVQPTEGHPRDRARPGHGTHATVL